MNERKASVLTLTPVSLAKVDLSEHAHLSASNFFDFVVDGVSLRSTLNADDVGVLSADWPSSDFAKQLLLESPGDYRLEGLAQIYGCRECLDVLCGGIAVRVTQVGTRVRWDQFEKFWPHHHYDRFEFEPIAAGPYEFDSSQYRSAFESFLT